MKLDSQENEEANPEQIPDSQYIARPVGLPVFQGFQGECEELEGKDTEPVGAEP